MIGREDPLPSPITVNKFLHKKLDFDPDALVPVVIMSEIRTCFW